MSYRCPVAASGDREAEMKRLAVGATMLHEVADRDSRHTMMADAEGNEFDVQ